MYGKVFEQMYDGTLATQGPWQALVTFQQFIVLADKDGVVDMTPEAISRRTTLPIDLIKHGISVLEQPDPHSRTPTEEGRRIVPLSEERNWGWRIVNYAKYRTIRSEEERRAYHREYYRTKRSKKASTQQLNTSQQTQPIAVSSKQYVKAEAEETHTPSKFSQFWESYPRKVGKIAAHKAWKRMRLDGKTDQVLKAIEQQKKCDDWNRDGGRFIPHPATWLNRGGWEDQTHDRHQATRVNIQHAKELTFGPGDGA